MDPAPGGLRDGAAAQYLAFAFLGVFVGTAVGVLPGIGPAMTVALLLPLTYTLDSAAALITFAGIYYGGMYGGSTTSILLNTPGESASIVTAIEGNKMARMGRGAAALATAAIGSFIAGTLATLGLTLLAPLLARFAVNLGPADYVALIVIAFITVGALIGSSISRGMLSLGVGLFLGLVGTDWLSGQQRYTLGLPAAVRRRGHRPGRRRSVRGRGDVLHRRAAATRRRRCDPRDPRMALLDDQGRLAPFLEPWLRGTAIGFPIGTIPAGGADVATFLSYATERKLSKHREEFGRGAIEGVAGPESGEQRGRRGCAGAAAHARPSDDGHRGDHPHGVPVVRHPAGSAAVREPVEPGVGAHREPVHRHVILIVLNLPLVGMWVKLLQIPRPYLYAGILLFAVFGAYALHSSPTDIVILLVVGILGYFMRRYGYPVAPLVVGMILGPMAEEQLRKALQLSQGDLSTLVLQPFAAAAYAVLALLIVGGLWLRRRQRRYEQALTESIAVPIKADSRSESEAVGSRGEEAASRLIR